MSPHWQSEDGSYTGFIKVHLKLRRPVTVPAGIRPQSIYDAIKEVNLAATTDKRTSFYLPLDAIKQLHISSTTTVSEVIQGLLKKFMVVDNPQKFALFKRMHKDGQGRSELPASSSIARLCLCSPTKPLPGLGGRSRLLAPRSSHHCGVGPAEGPGTSWAEHLTGSVRPLVVPLAACETSGKPCLGFCLLICGVGGRPPTAPPLLGDDVGERRHASNSK